MKAVLLILTMGATVVALSGCEPPLVLQGTVVRYQAESKTLVFKGEIPPNPEVTLSLEGAEIGADPAPGDLVRLAYRKTEAGVQVLRLMNLSKQKELTKGAAH